MDELSCAWTLRKSAIRWRIISKCTYLNVFTLVPEKLVAKKILLKCPDVKESEKNLLNPSLQVLPGLTMQPTHSFQEIMFSSFVTSGTHQAVSHTLLQTGHTESAFAVTGVTASKSGLQGEKQETGRPNKAWLQTHSENRLGSRKVNSLYFAAAAVCCHTPPPAMSWETRCNRQPLSQSWCFTHIYLFCSPQTHENYFWTNNLPLKKLFIGKNKYSLRACFKCYNFIRTQFKNRLIFFVLWR